MLTHTIITDVNVDESIKKRLKLKTYETFYLCDKSYFHLFEEYGKSYRKQKFYEIHIKHGE